ncbi:hypothetical protein EYF80_067841 [Liparis tanakae]|uniref:Uncharacterized protein n=1 Tax=Liparis tanakae TaxID=230148 RepID=A0A4Z2DZT9_9TELE|nr:hypothetical protein EYF80_067841 [Liparis tanakae]
MASGRLSRAEALARPGCRHASHVMLYCDTDALLFGVHRIRHVVLVREGLWAGPSKRRKAAGQTFTRQQGR